MQLTDDLRGALAVYGGSLAYADQVLALARAPQLGASSLPVVLPIPAPGRVQRIATPAWPANLAAHMNPSAVTNQCVAGALATWALMHVGDPFWNHLAPLMGNAIDLYGVRRPRVQVNRQPVVGAMVVYGSSCGMFGHIATVRAVQGDRYEVVEQQEGVRGLRAAGPGSMLGSGARVKRALLKGPLRQRAVDSGAGWRR